MNSNNSSNEFTKPKSKFSESKLREKISTSDVVETNLGDNNFKFKTSLKDNFKKESLTDKKTVIVDNSKKPKILSIYLLVFFTLVLVISLLSLSFIFYKNFSKNETVESLNKQSSSEAVNSFSSLTDIPVDFYQNQVYNFSFQYPKTWKVFDSTDISGETQTDINLVNRILPQKNETTVSSNSFDSNIAILVNKKPEIQNLPAAVNQELETFSKSEGVTDYKLISEEKTIIDQALTIKVVQTAKIENILIKQYQSFVYKNEVLYVITYTSSPDLFEENLVAAQEIVNSLKLP